MKKGLFKTILAISMLLIVLTSCGKEYTLTYFIDDEVYQTLIIDKDTTLLDYGPEKVGYTFDGWYSNDIKVNTLPNKISSDISLEGKYTIINYKIEYSSNFENLENENPTEYTIETDTFKLTPLNKEGYIFDGWFMNDKRTEEIEKGTYGDLKLTASWSVAAYSITYKNTLDSTHSNPLGYSIDSDDIILNDLEKDGYIFDGWYLNDQKIESISKGTVGDLTLTAKWTKDSTITYIDEFNTSNNNPTSYNRETETIVLKPLFKEGYTFNGWYNGDVLVNSVETGTEGDLTLTAKWTINSYEVTFIENMKNSVSLSCEKVFTVEYDTTIDDIIINANLGYKFEKYTLNNVDYTENIISSLNVKSDIEINVSCDYLTYEIGIINIDTEDVDIPDKYNYVDSKISIFNTGYNELQEAEAGIRLRGNSTLGYPKKAYRIKFDKKQSLYGLEKAKSWVLLAEYIDPSALHNYTAYTLGNELDGLNFTVTPNKVNVYLNGICQGLYTLCEQVQENEGRMNIEKDITEDMNKLTDYNFFVELDANLDVDSVLNENYFTYSKYIIQLKYPEKENFSTDAQFNDFFSMMKEYVCQIMNYAITLDENNLLLNLDINSLIDYSLIDIVMGEWDHEIKSFNMYYIGDENKLYFGPVWDYDWSINTPWTGWPNETFELDYSFINFNNLFIYAIESITSFKNKLVERYVTVMKELLETYISNYDALVTNIQCSLELNNKLWYTQYNYDITASNVVLMKTWLINRKAYLDQIYTL